MFKTVKGLILKRRRFGEAHAYVTALTSEGLVTFSAYGIMSAKNKNFASCQPYTLSELVLSTKGEAVTLSQSSTIAHLIRQGIELDRLSLANYIVSMASETTYTGEDAPDIYTLTCTALSLIDSGEVDKDIIKAVYEFKLTSALGFYPDLTECALCGGELDGATFVYTDGNAICTKCLLPEGVKGVTLSPAMLRALQKLLSMENRASFGIRFSDLSEKTAFCTLAERFSSAQLDCARTALTYYKDNLKNFMI